MLQAAMLQGFAVECLLKCFWIVQGNTVADDGEYKIKTIKRENHDIVQIAAAVGFELSKDESASLVKLSGFARSFGRYPIAKKWQDQPLMTNEFGVDCGPSWENEDHAIAEAVLARLTTEIESRRGSGRQASPTVGLAWEGDVLVHRGTSPVAADDLLAQLRDERFASLSEGVS